MDLAFNYGLEVPLQIWRPRSSPVLRCHSYTLAQMLFNRLALPSLNHDVKLMSVNFTFYNPEAELCIV